MTNKLFCNPLRLLPPISRPRRAALSGWSTGRASLWLSTRTHNFALGGLMPGRPKPSLLRNGFVLAVVTFTVFVPVPCWAQGFPPLSPEDLKMTSEPKAPGAPAIILYREIGRAHV